MKNKPLNILILTHWSFKDALIQSATLPYVKIIREIVPKSIRIILITFEQEQLALSNSEMDSINIGWKKENMQLYTFGYFKLGLKKYIGSVKQVWAIRNIIRKEKIGVMHVFGTSNAGSMSVLLNFLTGIPLIIDSYEPHADCMVENGTWKANSFGFRLLLWFERQQTLKGRYFVATTSKVKEYAEKRFGKKPKNFYVKPACVDLEKFKTDEKDPELIQSLGLSNKLVCVYAGKMGDMYLKSEIFDFVKVCEEFWGERFRFLMLSNALKEDVQQEASKAGVREETLIHLFAQYNEVSRYMSVADFALNPVKPVPTKKYCTSIKDGEYWAKGLPVVITKDISDDSDIIKQEQIGYVLEQVNQKEFRNAVELIDRLLKKEGRSSLQKRIREIAVRYRSYNVAKEVYTAIYTDILN